MIRQYKAQYEPSHKSTSQSTYRVLDMLNLFLSIIMFIIAITALIVK